MRTRATLFRKLHYPGVTALDWNDWRWQIRNRINSLDELGYILNITEDEAEAVMRQDALFPLNITPYYASLLNNDEPYQPLRRSMVPLTAEFNIDPSEDEDPLKETAFSPIPCIVHRYPDRVLFLVTNQCSVHCRYCTRSRLIKNTSKTSVGQEQWDDAVSYIKKTKRVRDVLISGGDPLTLPDEKLEWLLSHLKEIGHIEMMRIGTKVPMALPQRITHQLTRLLKRYHPLWMSIHIIHPSELTSEAIRACNRLIDSGIPLMSQTVLLRGINDQYQTIRQLVHNLIKLRIKPYYLFHCDPVSGSAHFRTSIEKGIQIIKVLQGHTTGYAIPTFAIDLPGNGGKVPLSPEYIIGRENGHLIVKNYQGETFRYPDP